MSILKVGYASSEEPVNYPGLVQMQPALCRYLSELAQLLKKQSKVLEARTSGGATDTEILE